MLLRHKLFFVTRDNTKPIKEKYEYDDHFHINLGHKILKIIRLLLDLTLLFHPLSSICCFNWFLKLPSLEGQANNIIIGLDMNLFATLQWSKWYVLPQHACAAPSGSIFTWDYKINLLWFGGSPAPAPTTPHHNVLVPMHPQLPSQILHQELIPLSSHLNNMGFI